MGASLVVASGLIAIVLAAGYVYRRTGQAAWVALLLAACLGRGLIGRAVTLALFRDGDRDSGFRAVAEAVLPAGTTRGDVAALEWGLFLWLIVLLGVWGARGTRAAR